MDYLQELNDVQRAAVTTTEGPVMVIAGPGSGKTRVLTYRIAHLITVGVYPSSILSLTFTNKAAKEMKHRISQVVGDKAKQVWAGTFHSIFARILRVEANRIGYPSNFVIYDSDDSKSLIGTIIKEMNLDPKQYPANTVRSRISSAKSNLITPKLYVNDPNLMEQDRFNRRPRLFEIYNTYVSRCKQAGAMDFDDLLFRLFELFQNHGNEVLPKYRQRFQYVMVDEFQDTNFLQYAILKKLCLYEGSPKNLCIVGDDAQSIYAFRGATIDNILYFEKDFPNLQVFKLEQNYRSTPHIVKAANDVITNNRRQIKKEIWTAKDSGEKIKLYRTVSDTEEGRRVADLIVEFKNRHHVPNNEIAILYRTNSQSRIFEEYLRRYNIQYKVFGGLSFYQRKEVKDCIAYLRLSVNLRDEEALRRIINYPKRGIGKSSLDKFSQFAAENNMSLWEALSQCPASNRVRNLVGNFQKMILLFQKKAQQFDAYKAASYIIGQAGLIDYLKKDNSIEGLSRIENVTSLLDGIQEFVEQDEILVGDELTEGRDLATYLQNIALLTDSDQQEDSNDYVTLMSVHSAKGLEFDAVFIVGIEENIFPSFQSMDTQDNIDEERRLFYVAITRARKLLTLTYATTRYRFGKIVYNEPSRFLEEISEECVQTDMRREQAPTGNRAGVSGHFPQRKQRPLAKKLNIPADFEAAQPHQIDEGMKVRHLKFGEGTVISIDGYHDSKVATIHFEGIDNPKRRIMLKFSKLQILESEN